MDTAGDGSLGKMGLLNADNPLVLFSSDTELLRWDMQTFGCLHDKESKLRQARSSEQAGIVFLILSILGSRHSAGSSVLSCGVAEIQEYTARTMQLHSLAVSADLRMGLSWTSWLQTCHGWCSYWVAVCLTAQNEAKTELEAHC